MKQEQKQTIKELADLLKEQNLAELEYEEGGLRIRIVGERPHQQVCVAERPEVPAVPPQTLPATPEPVSVKNMETIDSPMVGVVYLAKSPDAPAFVSVGDTVSIGQTVCLIEAMKTFNPVKATKAGVIREVLVAAGSPVEFGQPLFKIG